MVHTKLLSGSLNPELNLTGAQRRKALEGRAMELAGKTKVGKGETVVREAERSKAAKQVRMGMIAKQKERGQKELEEASRLLSRSILNDINIIFTGEEPWELSPYFEKGVRVIVRCC